MCDDYKAKVEQATLQARDKRGSWLQQSAMNLIDLFLCTPLTMSIFVEIC